MPQPSKKRQVRDLAAERQWMTIGEVEWQELRATFSESTIRDCGIPIDAPWSGIRQHSLEELAISLQQFADVYAARPDLRRYCRDQVITAKDHARWASRHPDRRALKTEMVEWLLVWLDDPAMFVTWMKIRRAKIEDCSNT